MTQEPIAMTVEPLSGNSRPGPAACTAAVSLAGRRGYAALAGAQFLGAFNDNLYKMIVSLLVVGEAINVDQQRNLSSTGGVLSAAGIVFILPYVLFSGYAGYLADSFDKRSVLVITKLTEIGVMALALTALLIGRAELLYATLFLIATQATFFSPAKYGILPETLPAALLSQANGLLEMSRYAAVILGTAMGGALLVTFADRPGWIGVILLAVAGLGAALSLRIDAVPGPGIRKPFRINPWAETMAGVRRLAQDRQLGLAVAGITYFETCGCFVLMDVLLVAKETMGRDDLSTSMLGAVVGTGVGLGAAAAGRFSRGKVELGMVPIGAVGFAAALLGACAAIENYLIFVLAIGITGFCGGLFFLPLNALMQHRAGPGEKGHVIATNNFLNMLGVLLACIALWIIRDIAGVPPDWILLWSGVVAVVMAGAILCFLRTIRSAAVDWLAESSRLWRGALFRSYSNLTTARQRGPR